MPLNATLQRPVDACSDPLDSDVLDELRGSLGPPRLGELLALLDTELDRRPRVIRAALADRDYAQALSAAHSFKGAAASLGAAAVADAARALEWAIAAAAEGDSGRVASALYRLRLASEEARRFLAAMPSPAPCSLVPS